MTDSQWTVGPDEAGARLDKFLASPDRLGSRGRATAALERGKVFLNGDEATPSQGAARLTEGDTVRVWMDRPGSAKRTSAATSIRGAKNLQIVYEDESWWSSTSRRACSPCRSSGERTRRRSMNCSRSTCGRRKRRPFVVHRIDRDTSGLVVFTKDPRTQRLLREQFKRREPERVYLAVVYGHPNPPEGTLVRSARVGHARADHEGDASARPERQGRRQRLPRRWNRSTRRRSSRCGCTPASAIRSGCRRGFAATRSSASSAIPSDRMCCGRLRSRDRRCTPTGWRFAIPRDERPVPFESPLAADVEAAARPAAARLSARASW